MSNPEKNRREALHIAAMVSPLEDGNTGPVLERARTFEDYLNGVSEGPDDEFLQLCRVLEAVPGENLLDAAKRYAARIQDNVSAEVDTLSHVAANTMLTQLEVACVLRPDLREWIRDVQTAFRDHQRLPDAPRDPRMTDTATADHEPDLFPGALWVDRRPSAAVKYLYRVGVGDEAWLWVSSYADVVSWLNAGTRPVPYTWREATTDELYRATRGDLAEFYGWSRSGLYGDLLSRLGTASTADPRVTRWIADVRGVLDRSNEPRTVALPQLEPPETFTPELHIYRVETTSAPPPPDDVGALRDAGGAVLVRSSWVASDVGPLWQWVHETDKGPAMAWPEALELADLPLIDVTTEERERLAMTEEPRHARRPAEPPAPVPPSAIQHDNPARSSNPERYEVRKIGPDELSSNVEREVLVCRDCVSTMGEDRAGRGNVVDVARHDAFHAEQDGGVTP